MDKINFAFFGTPDVAAETLEILKEGGYLPSLVVTSPDRPQGRKMIPTPPPAKVWAEQNGIPYIQPETTEELLPQVGLVGTSHKSDLWDTFIVVAYGKIIPENILNIPKMGSLNIHYSLLPKYRGASPVESAILQGETETGVSIQKMTYKLDSGPIIAMEKINIDPEEKAPDLRKRMIKIGGELLVKTLPGFVSGNVKEIPQNESEATFCGKIKKEDGLIDLNADPAKNYNKFRAYASWPRTFFFKEGKRIVITDATLKDGKFVIKKVIPEGKKEMAWEDSRSTAG